MIYTVFPKEDGEMPQDFDTYSEARGTVQTVDDFTLKPPKTC